MHEAAGLSLLPCGHAVVTCEACNPGGLSLAAALPKPQMGEATTWQSPLCCVPNEKTDLCEHTNRK